jgi:hypothetical protein
VTTTNNIPVDFVTIGGIRYHVILKEDGLSSRNRGEIDHNKATISLLKDHMCSEMLKEVVDRLNRAIIMVMRENKDLFRWLLNDD